MTKKRKKKEKLDLVFILDRSGSMCGSESDTIGGYNSYLDNMKDKDVKVTTVLFDTKYDMISKREDISNVKKLDNKTYITGGCSALLDAIGNTIKFLDKEKAKKVLLIITTDGFENSSTDYNKSQIKELIQSHNNWEFIFLGADIDSYNEASSIGIKKERISNYSKDNTCSMFERMGIVAALYDDSGVIDDNWNEGLEDYIEKEIGWDSY